MPLRVALLRSMVVNGQRINAQTTAALAEAVGGEDVRTAGSTGNLVFRSAKSPATLTRELEAACEKSFGKPTEIIVKTERQWRALVRANPFRREAEETPNRVLAWVMRSPVPAKGLAQLRARADASEIIKRTRSGDFYIFFGRPNRDDTKLVAGFGLKSLGAVGTNRTWTTMTRITAVLDELAAG
jgi:uncharacterized protein (DUF1697 family)